MRVTPLIAYGCLVGLLGCEGASESLEPVAPPPPHCPAYVDARSSPGCGGGASGDPVLCETPAPSLAPAALLTRAQYDNTIADLLGDTTRPSSAFPPENQVDGFNNNIAAHQTNPLLVEKHLEAAEKLAAAAVGSALERIAPCSAGSDQRQCGKAFVRTFGPRAFRRPLTSVELQIFDGLFDRSFDASGYAFGVELVLTAMLQSPQFLYRVRHASGSPDRGDRRGGAGPARARLAVVVFLARLDARPGLVRRRSEEAARDGRRSRVSGAPAAGAAPREGDGPRVPSPVAPPGRATRAHAHRQRRQQRRPRPRVRTSSVPSIAS